MWTPSIRGIRELAVAAALFALPVLAKGDPREKVAREKYGKATKAYDLGKFEEALELFSEAYEAKELPGFLFNIAQCHRQLGDFERARFFYKRYLDLSPKRPKNAPQVEQLIAECDARIAERRKLAELEAERKRAEAEAEKKRAEADAAARRAEEIRAQASANATLLVAEAEAAKKRAEAAAAELELAKRREAEAQAEVEQAKNASEAEAAKARAERAAHEAEEARRRAEREADAARTAVAALESKASDTPSNAGTRTLSAYAPTNPAGSLPPAAVSPVPGGERPRSRFWLVPTIAGVALGGASAYFLVDTVNAHNALVNPDTRVTEIPDAVTVRNGGAQSQMLGLALGGAAVAAFIGAILAYPSDDAESTAFVGPAGTGVSRTWSHP